MNIELLTKSDLNELTWSMIKIQKEMQIIRTFMDNSKNRIITAGEICERLGISYSTFLNRREKLMQFGMFNDGKWKMKIIDLEKYLESGKNS